MAALVGMSSRRRHAALIAVHAFNEEPWIPAFAGMTANMDTFVIPAYAGIHGSMEDSGMPAFVPVRGPGAELSF